MEKYDIAIYGLWYGRNYGSILTYYALHSVLEKMGYSAAMIRNPHSSPSDDPSGFPPDHPFHFSREHYKLLPYAPLDGMAGLNSFCRMFLVGSDQLWNYALSSRFALTYFLDFADEHHGKVSYATSFGVKPYNGPEEDVPAVKHNLSRFDAISVRDSFSKQVAEEEFGVAAAKVIDPVLLCDRDVFEELTERKSESVGEGEYILAYILNPTEELGWELEVIARETGSRIVVVFDEAGDAQKHAKDLNVSDPMIVLSPHISVYDWVSWFKNARFVLTDSFHGICFSAVFHRGFLALQNRWRGPGRFKDIMEVLDIKNRLVENEKDLTAKYLGFSDEERCIDWERFEHGFSEKKEFGRSWLSDALMKGMHK